MNIDVLATQWANEFEYAPHETPARKISAHGQQQCPELVIVVNDAHMHLLGREEPIDPWLIDQTYYILEAVANSDGTPNGVVRSFSTNTAIGPEQASADELLAWREANPAYASMVELAAQNLSTQRQTASILDMIRYAQYQMVSQLTDIVLGHLYRWAALKEGEE